MALLHLKDKSTYPSFFGILLKLLLVIQLKWCWLMKRKPGFMQQWLKNLYKNINKLRKKVWQLASMLSKLKKYGGDYRTSPLPFKIELTRTSVIKPVCDFPKEFPEKYFSDFFEILDDKLDKNIL
ncbi:unnamed protein product [Thlaspi arvense]|uniref:Uncharacterized protein n=1 Tax=Thlaspi arvense TaxID=13288 RepID=A0AAU9RY58_THLAR|nr:unnamed protein product [Thlaspi arvense]